MSSPAGWYPDPGGAPGKYRYWDGHQWSTVVQDTPGPPPTPPPPQPSAGRAWPWWVGAAVVLVALTVLITWGLRAATGGGMGPNDPDAVPSADLCPSNLHVTPSPVDQPDDGRVHGGDLSFPMLGEPFSAPIPEYNVPFSRDTMQQIVLVESQFDGTSDWITTVMVGRLVSGDGFYTPEQGAATITECVIGEFYGNAEVGRADRRNEAITIDGHDAWIIESDLSFDVEGLETDGELLIVAVVDTGEDSAGLFYASIPNTVPHLEEPIRGALDGLTVDD